MENNYFDICAQNVPQHNENVGGYETNLWRTPSCPASQSIQANNNVKIRISNSKEVKNTITLSTEEQDGNGIRSSWETSRIASSSSSSSWQNSSRKNWSSSWWHSSELDEKAVNQFFSSFWTCRFGLPEHSPDNLTGCVHSIHTRRAHNEHNIMFTSTDRWSHMCLAQELHSSLSAHKRMHPAVIHVVTLLVLVAAFLSQPAITQSTTWTARSSPRTLYTTSTTSTLLVHRIHNSEKYGLPAHFSAEASLSVVHCWFQLFPLPMWQTYLVKSLGNSTLSCNAGSMGAFPE